MFDIRWIGVLGCLAVAVLALVIMLRERSWAQRRYKQELKLTVLQPEFIAELRKQLESDVQDHVKKALVPLGKEVQEAIVSIKKQTETSIAQGLTANANALEQAAQDHSATLQAVIEADAKHLHAQMQVLSKSVDSLQVESQALLTEYRQQVLAKVKHLVEEQAADVLAEYLQSSLQGLELGDQQDFILERLEANKTELLAELGHDQK